MNCTHVGYHVLETSTVVPACLKLHVFDNNPRPSQGCVCLSTYETLDKILSTSSTRSNTDASWSNAEYIHVVLSDCCCKCGAIADSCLSVTTAGICVLESSNVNICCCCCGVVVQLGSNCWQYGTCRAGMANLLLLNCELQRRAIGACVEVVELVVGDR